MELNRVSLQADFSTEPAGRVDPVEDLHQRGFAGAVLAEQGVDVAARDEEVDLAQDLDRSERDGDAAHLQRVGRAGGVAHRLREASTRSSSWR